MDAERSGGRKIAKARRLRRAASVVERIVWTELRDKARGFKFRRQQPIGTYVLDFYCAEARLAVEFDGQQHDPARDELRDLWLVERGIETFRVPNTEFLGIESSQNRDWLSDVVRRCEGRSGRTL